MTATPRRPAIFGPEPWATIAGTPWCHFDRWFALEGATSFACELDALGQELVGRLRWSLHSRGDVEATLSHVADLRSRMASGGIDVSALASYKDADKASLAKARREVLDHALEGRAMTKGMREAPRVRLDRRARYGHWERFPVNLTARTTSSRPRRSMFRRDAASGSPANCGSGWTGSTFPAAL